MSTDLGLEFVVLVDITDYRQSESQIFAESFCLLEGGGSGRDLLGSGGECIRFERFAVTKHANLAKRLLAIHHCQLSGFAIFVGNSTRFIRVYEFYLGSQE